MPFSTGIFVDLSTAVSRRGNCMVGNTSPVASPFQRFRNCLLRKAASRLLMMLLVIRCVEAGQRKRNATGGRGRTRCPILYVRPS